MTDLERTLLDGLAMPQHCGGFGEAIYAVAEAMGRLDLERIAEYAQRLGPAVAKRAGWVLELHGCEAPQLEELAAIPIKGHRKLDPTGPKKGAYNIGGCFRRTCRGWWVHEGPASSSARGLAPTGACNRTSLSGTTCCPGYWPASVRFQN